MESNLTKVKTVQSGNTQTSVRKPSTKRLANQLAKYVLEKKAHNVLIMDLRKITTMTDFFVLCSGDSDVQVKAIVDNVDEKMKKRNLRSWHREGYENLQWVLLDYVDVVLHVFHKDTREFYCLESLWGDAKIETVGDEEGTESGVNESH